MERAERSGGLHKRSAEDWGHGLRARGAELPLDGLAVAFRVALRAGTGPQRWVADDGEAGRRQGGYLLPVNFLMKKLSSVKQTDDRQTDQFWVSWIA